MKKRSKIQWMFYLKENFWNSPKKRRLLQKQYWNTFKKSKENETSFQKFTKKKWIDLITRLNRKNSKLKETKNNYLFNTQNINTNEQKSKIFPQPNYNLSYKFLLQKRLLKKRRYFKIMLQQKHRFKLYFRINKEKKFKKILRKSFKVLHEKRVFDQNIINRLDSILVSINFCKNKEIAQELIKTGFIFINNKKCFNFSYKVTSYDIISIDDKIKLYILKNLKKQIQKSKYLTNLQKVTKKVSKVFEINYETLDVILLDDNNLTHFKDNDKISLDFIRRAYKK